mmetsp:Transcript_11103/g.35240  ORF Transcript_11103/g.35240 Transcript_11103/m.35240 type:complete len:261 (-) Transcript_11103:511-1293(-)
MIQPSSSVMPRSSSSDRQAIAAVAAGVRAWWWYTDMRASCHPRRCSSSTPTKEGASEMDADKSLRMRAAVPAGVSGAQTTRRMFDNTSGKCSTARSVPAIRVARSGLCVGVAASRSSAAAIAGPSRRARGDMMVLKSCSTTVFTSSPSASVRLGPVHSSTRAPYTSRSAGTSLSASSSNVRNSSTSSSSRNRRTDPTATAARGWPDARATATSSRRRARARKRGGEKGAETKWTASKGPPCCLSARASRAPSRPPCTRPK